MPNGLCFSPDESLLYINDTPRAYIKVFDVNADGTLAERPVFFEGVGTGVIEEGIPDGMKVRRARQRLGHRPGRRLGHLARASTSERSRCPRCRQPHLGRPGLAHAVHSVLHLRLHDSDHGRPPPRALHALAGEER